jgi:hypothetical protein
VRVDVVPPGRSPRESGHLRVGFGPPSRGRRDLPSLSAKSVSVGGVTRSHWGQGALETAENILRTLQDVVQISCNVTAEHMPRTFGM